MQKPTKDKNGWWDCGSYWLKQMDVAETGSLAADGTKNVCTLDNYPVGLNMPTTTNGAIGLTVSVRPNDVDANYSGNIIYRQYGKSINAINTRNGDSAAYVCWAIWRLEKALVN